MFCPMCGTQVDHGAATCSSCRSELPTKDDGSNPWILSSPSSLKIDRLLFFCDSVAVIITGLIVVHVFGLEQTALGSDAPSHRWYTAIGIWSSVDADRPKRSMSQAL